ncbi:MAG: hypothetical protein FJ164_02090 [Gammaproteobacteria bacterium]|nr:hypothetical protein [Gammaproteobacteria bacterium]
MTRLLILCGLLAATVCHANPDIQRFETRTGVPILFVAAPEIPMFIARVVFAAGSAQDGELPGPGDSPRTNCTNALKPPAPSSARVWSGTSPGFPSKASPAESMPSPRWR